MQEVANATTQKRSKHHEHTIAVINCRASDVMKLKETFGDSNPFQEDSDVLFNLITRAVMPEKVQKDILRAPDIGKQC